MKLEKTKYARLVENNDRYFLGVGTKQKEVDILKYEKVGYILSSQERIDKVVEDEDPIVKELEKLKLLVPHVELKEDIYFKSLIYEELMLDNAINSKKKEELIIIAGCGGIGNFILYSLASFGFKNFLLIDGDVIEESNLNRQFLFQRSDIGKFKVEALKRRIKEKYNDLKIKTIINYVDREMLETVKEKVLVCIVSADSENVVSDINDYALKTKTPYLPVGYMNDISVIGPFVIPGKTACLECNNLHSASSVQSSVSSNSLVEMEKINSSYTAPSSFINNSISSAMAMIDLLYFISGDIEKINSLNKRIGINNTTFEKQFINIQVKETCKCQN